MDAAFSLWVFMLLIGGWGLAKGRSADEDTPESVDFFVRIDYCSLYNSRKQWRQMGS